jgi:hypothetical protein
VTEVLRRVEEDNATSCRHPRDTHALLVTLEVYGFEKERHDVWEVPCIRPSESGGPIAVAAKVSARLLPSGVH